MLRERGSPQPLVITTNYDDLVERALDEAHVEYDVLRYVATGPDRGKFAHEPPGDGEPAEAGREAPARGPYQIVDTPRTYTEVDPDERTVVLKIHGSVDRKDRSRDSYVITEDDYISYLTETNLSALFPVNVLAKLLESNLLFLGYGMRDWNLRVILYRILEERGAKTWTSWAVQNVVDPFDKKLWDSRNVKLHEHTLSDYIAGLEAALKDVMR